MLEQNRNRGQGSFERSRHFCDGVVDRGNVAINADLHAPHAKFAQLRGTSSRNEQRIGLQADVEMQPPRGGQNFVKIRAQEDFAAAEGQKKSSRARQIIQHLQTLGGGQFPMIVVIQIAVHAALVTAVSQIKMHAERPVLLHRARDQTIHYRGGDWRWSHGQGDTPPAAGTVTTNFREDISSKRAWVSDNAMSGVTW